MKNIVVPTDFSSNAREALMYAIHFANQLDECVIHLVHVFAVRSETGLMASVNAFMKRNINEELTELVEEAKPSLFNGTKLLAAAYEGYPIDTINEYAETVKADYVIMGTKGASGLKSVFVGSNTSGLIKQCARPIIVVPAKYEFKPIRKIALAIDSKDISRERILSPMVKIAEVYRAKVDVVHVEPAREMATIDAGVDIYLSEVNRSFHYVEGSDVNEGLHSFLKEHNSDLLCMIHRDRSFINRLIFESLSSIEAMGCPVPLLVVRD